MKQKASFSYWTATFPWMIYFLWGACFWIFLIYFSSSMALFRNRRHLFHIEQQLFLGCLFSALDGFFFSFFSFSMLLFWNRQHLFHIKQEIFLWWRLCHFWWHVSALFCTLCIVWYFFHHWLHFFKTYYTFSILNLNYSFYSIFSTLDGNFLHFCEIFQCQLHLFET